MDLILSKPFRLGKMLPTWSLIVARGATKGRLEGMGLKSVKEAQDWAHQFGHTIIAKEVR